MTKIKKLIRLTSCGMCGLPMGMEFDPTKERTPSVSKCVGPCCKKDSEWILVDTRFSFIGGLQYPNVREHAKQLKKMQEEA